MEDHTSVPLKTLSKKYNNGEESRELAAILSLTEANQSYLLHPIRS